LANKDALWKFKYTAFAMRRLVGELNANYTRVIYNAAVALLSAFISSAFDRFVKVGAVNHTAGRSSNLRDFSVIRLRLMFPSARYTRRIFRIDDKNVMMLIARTKDGK